VLGVWVTVLIVGVTLLVLLWGGGTFLQAYFYTEPSAGLFWRAPAAAAALTLFYALWCLLDYSAEGARPGYLPYDTIFRFSADEAKGTKPVERLWAVKKTGPKEEKVRYKRFPELSSGGRGGYRYYQELADGTKGRPWSPTGVVALLVPEEGEEIRYELVKSDSVYRRFVSPDGWTIIEYDDGPTGQPTAFRTGLWLVNLLLNLVHLGLWFVCLWLLMRFQWGHALGLGFVMWLVMTLLVVPMMLVQAGDAAREAAGLQRPAGSSLQPPRLTVRRDLSARESMNREARAISRTPGCA
jgi:hypothetical protein